MLEQFPPQPDDTLELAVMPAHRRVALIVSAGVVAIGVLIGVGFLVFGGLGASGGGLRSPGLLPAISPQPVSASPSTTATTPVARTATSTRTRTTPPAVAVSIVNATMKPPTYVGPNCPRSTTGVATVTATGPVTITYRWVSTAITSPTSGTQSFKFSDAGSHRFSHAFPNITTPNGRVTATFVIVTPAPRRASMTYTQKCGASASKITPKITKDLTGLTCSVTFMSTIQAGVGPMTVSYHWEITGAGPGADSRSWTFPQGGGNHHASSSTRTLKHGSSATATLVLSTPVRFVTRTVTATCP